VSRVSRSTLEWYELIARGMTWAAAIVLLLAIVGAVVIAGSDSAVPTFEEAERQGRGFFALVSLGGGIAAAGMLAGLGAILRLLVSERLAKLGPAEERDEADPPPLPPIGANERGGPRKRPARERPAKPAQKKPAERKPRKRAAKKPAKRADETPDEG
jgi:hypothetical protein